MRITLAFTFIAFAAATSAPAQPGAITLQQAIDKGLSNRPELKSGQLQQQLAAGEDAKLRARWKPQVSASADFRINTQLQKSVIPVGAFGLPNIPSDATATVAFGVPFQNVIGIEVSQKIYDATRPVERQLNAANKNARDIELAKQRRDIRLAVTEAYYGVLFQQEKVRYAAQSLARAQAALDYGQERLRNGGALPNDIERLRLDLGNATLAQRKAREDLSLASEYLRYQMADPDTFPLAPAESLAQLLDLARLPEAQPRPEISLEENAKAQNALLQRKENLRNKPLLSAYGNYSILALNDAISPFNYLGLRASLPLYDGKQARLSAEDYRIRRQINDANLETLRANIRYEVESARKKHQQALADVGFSAQQVELARRIYTTDQYRFAQGALLSNDLRATELSLQTAEYNYLNAVYNALMASLAYLRALGG